MNNPFQEQLLKAGLVTKKQVQKAKQDKSRTSKKQRATKEPVINEAELKARQAAEKKAQRDIELNKKKEEQTRQKAISIEIDQLIKSNRLERDNSCDIVYNFEHKSKIKRIYVNDEQRKKIISGKLGIARIEGCYELVPQTIAEKIQQRNEKRIIICTEESHVVDENDPYAEHQIPDDLTW